MNPEEKNVLEKLENARNFHLKGDFSTAIQHYSDVEKELRDDPENLSIVQIEMGWSYYYNRNYNKAIEYLKNAINKASLEARQEFDSFRIIGFSYEMLGKLSQAIQYLEKALAVMVPEKDKRFTYFELGRTLFAAGQIANAEHYLKITWDLFSDDELEYKVATAYYLGFTQYFQKIFEGARDYFDYVIQNSEDPKNKAGGYFGIAHLHFESQDYQALIDTCEKILRTDNTFYDKETLGFFMSTAYYHLQQWKELKMFFNELERNYPNGRYSSEYNKFREALNKQSESQSKN